MMTLEEFNLIKENDVHSLFDMIKKNEIPITDLMNIEKQTTDFPRLIKTAILLNKDCTIEIFKKWYLELTFDTSTLTRDKILLESYIVENLSIIAYILKTNDTLEDIFNKYSKQTADIFNLLAKNENTDIDFKIRYYKLTNDFNIFPKKVQTIFIF